MSAASVVETPLFRRILSKQLPYDIGTIQELLVGSLRTGFITGGGDLACQAMESKIAYNAKLPEDQQHSYLTHLTSNEFKIDRHRFGSIWSFGVFFFGPVGGTWYKKLDAFVSRKWSNASHFGQVARKVALEQVFLGPLYTLAFFYFSQFGSPEGFNNTEFIAKLKQDYVSTLILDEGAWLIASPFLYGFVPVKQQLLVASALSALEAMAFSYIAFNSVEAIPVIGPILTQLLGGQTTTTPAASTPQEELKTASDKNAI